MSQINVNQSLETAAGGASANRFQAMSSEDFIRIMFTELSNQDPFQPNDSAAILDQLNSIRSIESDITLTDKLDKLVSQNELASAGGLVGKYISGLTDDARRVEGFVLGVSRSGDKISLALENGEQVDMDNLEEIVDPRGFEKRTGSSAA